MLAFSETPHLVFSFKGIASSALHERFADVSLVSRIVADL
jgi:hypothetical protein